MAVYRATGGVGWEPGNLPVSGKEDDAALVRGLDGKTVPRTMSWNKRLSSPSP